MDIFSKTELVALDAPDLSTPLVIGDSSLDTTGLYVTSIGGSHKPTVQILSAVDSSMWINTFGQRPSPTQISGIIVPTGCEDGTDAVTSIKKSLLNVYKKYKISAAGEPLQIAYNGMVMRGYFQDLNFNSGGQAGVQKAMQFSLIFLCVIESAMTKKELEASAFTSEG